jgi:aryl carrier-like protein
MTSGPVQDLSQVVAATWCAALGLESLPPNANVFLIGGDSLRAVMIAAELNKRLGTEIGLSDLLDAPTFDEFVDRLAHIVAANHR